MSTVYEALKAFFGEIEYNALHDKGWNDAKHAMLDAVGRERLQDPSNGSLKQNLALIYGHLLGEGTRYPHVYWGKVLGADLWRKALRTVARTPQFQKHNQYLALYAEHRRGDLLTEMCVKGLDFPREKKEYEHYYRTFLRDKYRAREYGSKV